MLEFQECLDYRVRKEALVYLDCRVRRVNLDEQPSLVQKANKVNLEGLVLWDHRDQQVLPVSRVIKVQLVYRDWEHLAHEVFLVIQVETDREDFQDCPA